MGLMDKVKAQASQLAEKTQEAARDGKVRFDQAQAKRRADAMLRNLGALVYAEHTGRGTPDSQAQMEKLITDIAAHEAENGISLAPESATGGPADTSAGPAATGFPQSGAPTGFPESGSAGFPEPGAGSTSFPQSGQTGFPPEGGSTQV